MARVNVYLPDELATEARQAGLSVSAITQKALQEALAARSTDTWLNTIAPAASAVVTHERALAALDATRDEPGTRHG